MLELLNVIKSHSGLVIAAIAIPLGLLGFLKQVLHIHQLAKPATGWWSALINLSKVPDEKIIGVLFLLIASALMVFAGAAAAFE